MLHLNPSGLIFPEIVTGIQEANRLNALVVAVRDICVMNARQRIVQMLHKFAGLVANNNNDSKRRVLDSQIAR